VVVGLFHRSRELDTLAEENLRVACLIQQELVDARATEKHRMAVSHCPQAVRYQHLLAAHDSLKSRVDTGKRTQLRLCDGASSQGLFQAWVRLTLVDLRAALPPTVPLAVQFWALCVSFTHWTSASGGC